MTPEKAFISPLAGVMPARMHALGYNHKFQADAWLQSYNHNL
jgi:hypothetical protein